MVKVAAKYLSFVAGPVVLYIGIVAINRSDPSYAQHIVSENGLIELLQWLVACTAFVSAAAMWVSMARGDRSRPILRRWFLLLALGCFYIAGEEVSWGQWFFNWSPPEPIRKINAQEETNLHNMSSWLNEKPRALFEIGVILGGILLPLLARFRGGGAARGRLALLLPSLWLLPTALLAEWVRMSERAPSLFRGEAPLGFLNTVRPSEVQELYFYLFILLYITDLRSRFRAGPTRAPAAG
jgi:hypothetical protein